ncbi:MAG: GGDEF domain-containing protein [Lachnospiraceae bacterium]|nr:GGDEF domain-containing protein [Lachnospiraceae bacterium]
MNQVLDQEEGYYLESRMMLEDKVSRYVSDYTLRLCGVNDLLTAQPVLRSSRCLQSLCTYFGMKEICIFGDDGTILLSSDELATGSRLLKTEDARPFADMIERGGDIVLNFECSPIISGGEGLNFMAVPSAVEGWSMVLIGIDQQVAAELQDEIAMSGLMLQIPTTHDNAMFAIDKNTGKLLGKTIGNDLLFRSGFNYNDADIQDLFRNSENGKIIYVAGIPTFLMTRTVNHVIFADLRLASVQIRKITGMLLGIILLNCVISFIALCIIKQYFHKYVFLEIDAIKKTICQIIGGDETAAFHADNSPEMTAIAMALNDWNKNIQHTQKKLNWIISSTAPDAAMFECLSYVNSTCFSDNLPSVLGMEPAQWNELKDDTERFKEYFSALDESKDENGIVAAGEKFLLLRLYKMDQDYFGIIVDKTASVKRKAQQAIDLKRAIDDSETDSLTGLLNRRGFESHVEKKLQKKTGNAVMLIMDVDNFKHVNDNLGHPEGDILLRKVGACLKQQFRESDIVARLGGDEFTVFFCAEMPKDVLPDKLDRLQQALREALADYTAYSTSISIGSACMSSAKACYETLYSHADKELYKAKLAKKSGTKVSHNTVV